MRRILPVVVAVPVCTLVGCETVPKATDQEKTQASRSFIECVRNATNRLDDRISDAYVIATAIVQGPCFQEAEAEFETYTRGSNDRTKEIFREDFFNRRSKETAIEIVLLERTR